MANGEVIVENESDKKEEIKQKLSDTINDAKKGVSNIIGKFGQKNNSAQKSDSIEDIKKFKELLDIGVITQEEFDKKKKELLNL